MRKLDDGSEREKLVKFCTTMMSLFKKSSRNDIINALKKSHPNCKYDYGLILDDAEYIRYKKQGRL